MLVLDIIIAHRTTFILSLALILFLFNFLSWHNDKKWNGMVVTPLCIIPVALTCFTDMWDWMRRECTSTSFWRSIIRFLLLLEEWMLSLSQQKTSKWEEFSSEECPFKIRICEQHHHHLQDSKKILWKKSEQQLHTIDKGI